ncbi:long-chain-fatty-acid--CoA ligase [Sinimarinibacterium sp. CAU 1509]|uniref:AMP-binding protein n=1 Tax=Sinimarinibacterium sp. CAU 1509 TaxID=2562283 RepID=UPI0010AB5728|nr:AMP-binding protein [Sinimarinibacterium sp. CAU 1509]TJY64799.1 long-chain-fatty-acid--CoA ligase [Sinimarinibacterium sp. CAU 1509]
MNFFWHRAYPLDVPYQVDLTRYSSVPELLRHAIEQRPDAIAFDDGRQQMTYRAFGEQASALSAYLVAALGLRSGERVAIMIPNDMAYPITALAVLEAGLVLVNVNPMYTPRELEHQLRDSGTTAIVIARTLLGKMGSVLQRLNIDRIIAVDVDTSWIPGSCESPGNPTSFELAIERGSGLAFVPPAIRRGSTALLQYTGGTVGPSKGAVLSHGNLTANVLQVEAWLGAQLRRDREVFLTALPLYHAYALTLNFLYGMLIGARLVLVTNPKDLPTLVQRMQQQRLTFISGVNTLFVGLMNTPGFDRIDFSDLHMTLGGGAATQPAVARRWRAQTGVCITEAYGMTEASPALCTNPIPTHEFDGSIGFPLPMTEVTLRDEYNRDVPIGEIGELCARGPQMMSGYWNAPEANALAFTSDGFFRTGDIARMDDHGRFYLVDRKKDMVLVSGFSVFPSEIEAVCAEHWGVAEAACVGVPDARTGEAVKVHVVRSDARLSAEDLIAHCRLHLTAYKVPRHVQFVEELPKSPVGKILRRMLREETRTAPPPTTEATIPPRSS